MRMPRVSKTWAVGSSIVLVCLVILIVVIRVAPGDDGPTWT
jgi:hypothetical protein